MKREILACFQNTEDYLSGQELCERFHVSRTAVWKAIHQLEAEGYRIEAVRNRGYRLISCPDVLLSEKISEGLTTLVWGRHIDCFACIDSTNLEIRRRAEAGEKEGLVAVADEQTAGRGRRGRSWVSGRGENIYMSFLLRPSIDPYAASMITIVTAMAAARAIQETLDELTGAQGERTDENTAGGRLEAKIKWPNDIVINGHKITGILTEMSTEMSEIQYIVTGIGINVNQMDFPEAIREHASSLRLELARSRQEREALPGKQPEEALCAVHEPERVDRNALISRFGNAFEQYYERFLAAESLAPLREEYESMLVNCGRQVRLVDAEGNATDETYYTALGINEIGELRIRDDNGEEKTVRAGEVSVRGIYGYV